MLEILPVARPGSGETHDMAALGTAGLVWQALDKQALDVVVAFGGCLLHCPRFLHFKFRVRLWTDRDGRRVSSQGG